MSILPHDDDPWQLRPAEVVAQQPEQPALRVETIENIEPLGIQLGVFPKKTAPDALHDAMFGQPDPSPAEIETAGGDPAAVPPMHTYAILDAAILRRAGRRGKALPPQLAHALRVVVGSAPISTSTEG